MRSDRRDSREFLTALLREANIDDEIIEDVVDACELARYSAFSLASKSVTVPMLAEKLYLTQEEAVSVKKVTLHRLCGTDTKSISWSSSLEVEPSSDGTNTTKISVEILPTSHESVQHRFHPHQHLHRKSFLSLEGLLSTNQGDMKISGSSGCKSTGSRGHWTDCTADRDSSDESGDDEKLSTRLVNDEFLQDINEKRDSDTNLSAQKEGMTTLADVQLDIADTAPRQRPYIPPLHLQDAGLSFGPPNAGHSQSDSFDTILFPAMGADSPCHITTSPLISHKTTLNKKKDQQNKKTITKRKKFQQNDLCHNTDGSNVVAGPSTRDRDLELVQNSKLRYELKHRDPSIPSYLRPTIASEAKRQPLIRKRNPKEFNLKLVEPFCRIGESQKCSVTSMRSKKTQFLQIVKPTRAVLARMEFIKNRSKINSFGGKESHFPDKISKTPQGKTVAVKDINKIYSKSIDVPCA